MSENTSPSSSGPMVGWLVLHAVCGTAILWLLLDLAPKFEKIFRDFNSTLPDMTVMLLNLSALFRRYWYVLIPGVGAGDIAVMGLLNSWGRARLMAAWGVLVWLAEMLLIGLILVALFVPLNSLISNLSGGQ